MFQKGFFKGVSREKIKEAMEAEGFSPKLIKAPPSYIYEPHQHPETKFLACLEGSVTINNKTHRFGPGDKLIIPGNTQHSAKVNNQGCTFFWSEKVTNKHN